MLIGSCELTFISTYAIPREWFRACLRHFLKSEDSAILNWLDDFLLNPKEQWITEKMNENEIYVPQTKRQLSLTRTFLACLSYVSLHSEQLLPLIHDISSVRYVFIWWSSFKSRAYSLCQHKSFLFQKLGIWEEDCRGWLGKETNIINATSEWGVLLTRNIAMVLTKIFEGKWTVWIVMWTTGNLLTEINTNTPSISCW